tara:strand:+ start:1430 stop:1651 length:222 start_codon:yes stop_codon:yes gene_type:complete
MIAVLNMLQIRFGGVRNVLVCVFFQLQHTGREVLNQLMHLPLLVLDVQEKTVQKVKKRIEASQARLAALEREK